MKREQGARETQRGGERGECGDVISIKREGGREEREREGEG